MLVTGTQPDNAPVDEATLALVTERLGRAPRGLRGVAVVDESGAPMVIRVASLVDGKPFPTLFWLIDPELSLRIDREEAGGRIATIQAMVDDSASLREALEEDHRKHIALRASFLNDAEKAQLRSQGQWSALAERGVGGIANFTRIRCLHTWYAAHLVVPNTVGHLLEASWVSEDSSS